MSNVVDVNNKAVLHEINFKLVKEGNLFNAFVFDVKKSEWEALMPAYTLYSSVIGALEAEMHHKAVAL